MADHLTEEEQIEAIKRWWSENWVLVVVPAMVLILGYSGWSFYSHNKAETAESASVQYQLLLDTLEDNADDTAAVRQEAQTIVNDYSSTIYADLANLILAKLDYEVGNIDAAQSGISTVIDQSNNDAVVGIAKARLAKVLIDKGLYDQAISQVAVAPEVSFSAQYAEIRGDAYIAQGNIAAAQTAYQEAKSALNPDQFDRRNMLDIKLNGIHVFQSGAEQAIEEVVEQETAENLEEQE